MAKTSPHMQPVSDSSELDALALDYGIESQFTDATGKLRETSAGTKRALLRAMGVRAGTAAEVRAACAGRRAAAWERALPPVVVAASVPIEIPIVLPSTTASVTWRVVLEDGSERSDSVVFRELRLLEALERGVERRTLSITTELALGYHRLTIDAAAGEMRLIVVPTACWLPPSVVGGERLNGIALQLYLLRSASNWGIGDFTDLRVFVELVAARGSDVVGLNPLHSLFVDDPEHASPYAPASRLLLNVLNIDVTAIPEFATSAAAAQLRTDPQFGAALAACRAAHLVDYSAVTALKIEQLRLLFAAFTDSATCERRAAFARFRAAGTQMLEQTYVFTALRKFFAAHDQRHADWQDWPAEYRDPASPTVAEFARDHAAEVTFVAWLQWIADAQLAAAAAAAAPMRVGLYRDLAVGAAPAGAEAWCSRHAVVEAARIGAPPDIHNPLGQNWDLPPLHPHGLGDEGYADFIELVRANMRHAGALRIDHVMALQHVYWIPKGAAAGDGAYVRYPLDDLVGILALESRRGRCMVVGEDLGTVPEGFRERMQAANVLSYRVLFFERDALGGFLAPRSYPRAAVAVLGSHDLPTLGAWWSGADIRLRRRLGLLADDDAVDAQLRARAVDREAFVVALRAAGALDAGRTLDRDTLFTAAHAFLAQTGAALAVAQIDDVTDETDPVNVPTTSEERPNWRRRLALTLEELATDPRFATLFDIFGAEGRLRHE
jgi:4-alpha-glucanotransferase